MVWSIPRIWTGETCFIIGGGPSVNKINPKDLKGKRIITTNDAYRLFPFAEFCFFFDFDWFERNRTELARFTGIKVSIAGKTHEIPWLRELKRGSKNCLSAVPTVVNHGVNSGHCAINLAVLLGATRIILVGFDMRVVDSNHNFHQNHEKRMKETLYAEEFIPSFDSLVDPLHILGIEIFNTTLDSAMNCFPKQELIEFL